MDANSQGAAELLSALMRTAARFSEMGRSVSRDFFPHVRVEPVCDLAGPAVRLGAALALPGHDLVFETAVAVGDGTFGVRGDLVLDGEEEILVLPPVETADPLACAALLDRYADELLTPARWHVQRLMESCEGDS
ncbi:hypothetical protein ACQPZZ_03970 [Microbispora sp. CA-135349]|uniref:hypothetical protein n=1 Tax=Microbispora sp. CA-135349 TaxID=3239953 RepID=UPI003D8D4236